MQQMRGSLDSPHQATCTVPAMQAGRLESVMTYTFQGYTSSGGHKPPVTIDANSEMELMCKIEEIVGRGIDWHWNRDNSLASVYFPNDYRLQGMVQVERAS